MEKENQKPQSQSKPQESNPLLEVQTSKPITVNRDYGLDKNISKK